MAHDINESGQVVGYATTAASHGHAFLWQDGVMTDLGLLGGSRGEALAINNFGQIVGRSSVAPNPTFHGALWQNGVGTDLTPGPQGGAANGINDSGQVVGTSNSWSGFLWQNGVVTSLGHLGGGGSFGADINNTGQAVGSSYTTHVTELGPMQHAFLWEDGVMIDLGVLPGDEESGAASINSHGHVVGSSGRTDPQSYNVTSRAFLYRDGVMTALPVPGSESYAGDINDAGQIVGTMRAGGGFSNFHGYIYADGVATNLNSLIPSGSGLHIAVATAINNAGQIAAWGFDARGSYHALLLTPLAAGTPVVNIGDVAVTENHAGTRAASLVVTLSASASEPVTVAYRTANGSAAEGSDYESASGTVTFEAGQTTKTISVLVNGDRAAEPNETVLVNLGAATGDAVIADGQGVVTIVDDEPRVSITDVSKNEGNSGTTQFVFTVSLSAASDGAVGLNFATANGSAKSPEDYEPRSGILVFNAGETSKTIAVAVKGDRKSEGQEVFYLNLSGASGALLADNQGAGVVRNDDR
jgi:probable HAF family extracellular repeat protein